MADRFYVPCVVLGNAIAVSKEKKTPSVKIALQTNDDKAQRTLYADLWLTDNAFEATCKTLEEVLGWQGEKLSELNEPILKGVEVDAVCEWESFTGAHGEEWREKVVFLNRQGGGGGIKKMEAGQVASVVSRLDAMLVARRRGQPGASAPVPRRSAPPAARQNPPDGANDFPGYAPPEAEGF